MDAFPAFIPLAGRKVAIAGSGPMAEAKARLFEGSPATLIHVPDIRAADPHAYAGVAIAFIAAQDEGQARERSDAAHSAGALVNVIDRPAFSDFTTPAVIDRGEVVAAIGTGGASPMLATLLRHDIEARVPTGAGRVAALFRRLQDEVRATLPDLHHRRAFLRAALQGKAAQAAMDGDMAAAEAAFRGALAAWSPQSGLVQVVDARGPADLLTLRAARALAAADVLVADDDADPEILALARRDAERIAPSDVGALIDLVRQGLRVARLVAQPGWRAEIAALDGAGIETEVLPIAG